MHFSKTILLAAVACLAPVVGFAAPVVANTSLSVGGFNFSNFGCSNKIVNPDGTLVTPSACNQISVNTITQPGVGITFTSDGFTALSSGPKASGDTVLTYNVSSAAGISSVGLDFNGYFEGLAITSVTEQVFNGSQILGQATVSCSVAGCSQSDMISLNGTYNNLYIKKDINVAAMGASVAQASYIDQTFNPTPEPGSTALLGSGLLAIAGLLRRRSILGLLKK